MRANGEVVEQSVARGLYMDRRVVSLAAHDVVNEGVGGVRAVVFGDRMHAFVLRLMHVELEFVSEGVHVLQLLVEVSRDEHVHVWELAFD